MVFACHLRQNGLRGFPNYGVITRSIEGQVHAKHFVTQRASYTKAEFWASSRKEGVGQRFSAPRVQEQHFLQCALEYGYSHWGLMAYSMFSRVCAGDEELELQYELGSRSARFKRWGKGVNDGPNWKRSVIL